MNEIKILELSLRNFKGIKELKLTPAGNNLNVYGENATGKTSIMDAFIWLLFDKDSSNSSNFNVKTLDVLGNPIHMLEHEVIAKLEIDSKVIELQKIYTEKWTKKRGQADSELTGHTTDYFINGVPKKLNEYKDYLKQIINEDTFKILTNPLYFNRVLDWKSRRNIALDICGELSVEDIINQDNKLVELKDLLVDKSIDDLKAEMTSRRRKLNEELKSIPYRIDEISRESQIKVDVNTLTINKNELESQLNEVKNSKGQDYEFRIRGVNGSVLMLENELKLLEQNLAKEIRDDLDKSMEYNSNIKKKLYTTKEKVDGLNNKIKVSRIDIGRFKADIEELRNKFSQLVLITFDEGTTICPTCKQSLPVEEIEKHKEEFEINKQEQLSEINVTGKNLKVFLNESVEALKEYEKALEEATQELFTVNEISKGKEFEIQELEKELKSIDITKLPGYKETQSKINHLILQRNELKKMSEQQDNTEQIKELELQISEINKELARVDLAKENGKRVEELKKRERELANMVAETEKTEFLCDQFVITKSNLLEDKLNSKFNIVKFKLFDVQVNGGINETFITTVEGVPFEDLNNAAKINAGLDIINTLTDYYNFKASIFIDNRESVNSIVDVKSQVINLIVSKDKKLKVEVER